MDLKKKVNTLPLSAGVYIFRDSKRKIIYIGKAVNLRARVRSYFKGTDLGQKTKELVKNITKIEHIKTDSEVEALILEAELIKRYKPKFNVVWKDDKNYIYIKITAEDYPRVSLVRQIVDDKAKYIGPFVSAGAVRNLLKYTRRIFMFRHCAYELKSKKSKAENQKDSSPTPQLQQSFTGQAIGTTERSGNGKRRKVCLQYSIGNCSGPCEGYISKREYRKSIRQMMKFFKGQTSKIEKEFRREMKAAAKAEDFERATMYRNRLMWVKKIKTIELGDDFDSGQARMTRDKALTGLRDALNLGTIPKRIECYDISNIFGHVAVGSMAVFVDGLPEKDHYRRFEIKTVEKISDTDMVREVLSRRLKKLRVSAKHFSQIKNSKLKNKKGDASFSQIPDLIIIDGGKGQLSVAQRVLDNYKLRLNIVSLAKRKEEIYATVDQHEKITDNKLKITEVKKETALSQSKLSQKTYRQPLKFKKIILPEGSESMYLIQRIRDEAHRFAITYHRSKRGKEMATSNLDIIYGVGPKTRKKLIQRFGSVDNIRKASVKDLAQVAGDKLAKKIKEVL